MDQPAPPWAALMRRLANRTMQRIVTSAMRGALRAEADGPQALARYVAGQRRIHMRFDAPVLARVDAEAVRQAGPGAGLSAPPSPSEWFAPRAAEPRGFVFYVHGGSFIAERSPRITHLVARFAAAAEARVFAPSYRLAPEHPCPAAVDDIVAAWRWFQETWPEEPVVALAESAGAAILLSALQQAGAQGLPLPSGVVLLSPWADLSLQSWSVTAASLLGTTPYTMESLALVARFYLDGRSATDPVASPLFGAFDGFPPTLIHASRGDILYDDAVRLADAIRAVGGDLTVRLWADETHVWERLGTPKARQSIELAADFIRRRLDMGVPHRG
ncbi:MULTISPECIES: alpha/beta hydrolase fold domain-containing protein [unclassified Phenylobacterium]|uniref:alpha/beta hydrolase fold domain-containing protein n=1 Tax=unclassified Phenylobacterium TaxID=2640670 RepID=UPI00083B91FF|nr:MULTISPECIES: alpha/beta hydrolase fold domain-containing protein [unclassified Phenylobacterium]